MHSTRRWFAAVWCAAALAGAWAWGCGGGQKGAQQATTTPPPAASAPQGAGTTAAAAATDVEKGEQIYKARCVLCHGPEGRGDGPGAAALNPKPRNHHDQAYMNSRTDAELLQVIHEGKGQMPAWKGVLTEDEMKQVLAYVRKLGQTP